MDETLNESLKNIFLKYLDTALNRTKDKFMIQQDKREQHETVFPDEYFPYEAYSLLQNGIEEQAVPTVKEVAQIRAWICKQTEWDMEQTFNRLTDREIMIVYLKVFKELTFVQIGKYMGESWQRIASSYTYARKKLKRGIENGL